MRRSDREITDPLKIKEIILACDCCRLGFCDNGRVYMVPLNFGYEQAADKRTFYFHSAKQGRKLDLIAQSGYAGFELDTNHLLHPNENPCECSFRFQSVIGEGTVRILLETQEKKDALRRIMEHYSGKKEWNFTDAMADAVTVFKLEAETLSCKEHL